MNDADRRELEYQELERLLPALCDGTLGPDDLRRLGERIAADPAARQQYLEYLDLHAALANRGPAMEIPEPATVPVPRTTIPIRPRSIRRVRWIAGLAAAAALVTLTTWAVLQIGNGPIGPRDDAPGNLGARLVELQGRAEVQARPGEAAEVKVGDEVRPGQTLRTGADDSYAVLELPDATRLELNADTQIRLAEDDARRGRRLILSAGLLRAEVQPQPPNRPLVVNTPQAEVVVLGTRFRVAAVPATATEVEAEAGTVRLTRLTDGASVDVPAGSAALAAAVPDPMAVHPIPQVPAAPRRRYDLAGAAALAFFPDGTRLAAAGSRRAAVFDVQAGQPVAASILAAAGKWRPLLTADGRRVLLRDRDGRCRILNTETGRPEGSFPTQLEPKGAGAISADGALVAGSTGHRNASVIRCWQVEDGRELKTLDAHGRVEALAFSRDSRRLAAGLSWTRKNPLGRVLVWDLTTETPPLTLPVSSLTEIKGVAWAPDGRQLAAVTQYGAAYLWDLEAKSLVAVRDVLDGWTRPVRALAFSPDGRLLAAGTVDGRVRLWNLATNQEWMLDVGPRAVTALAFAPDGHTLAVGMGNKNPVTLWDVPAE
jgi:ferric-dicitrate binding protein FerR (iron transport regulator)